MGTSRSWKKKYSEDEKSFRQTINANAYSNRGFTVKVNNNDRKVLIGFNPDKIDIYIHGRWAKTVSKKKLKHQPYWGFDDLFHKVATKLHNCFFVRADSKKINGKLHFHYQDIFMLKSILQLARTFFNINIKFNCKQLRFWLL